MKQKITLLFTALLIATAPILYGAEQTDSSKIYFENAFNELEEMLEEKLPPDFERAVFVSENAFHNNKYSYKNFQNGIDVHLYCINKLIEANDKSDSIDFNVKVNANGRFKMDDIRYLPREKKELYRKALANWAIFTYLTDTTALYPFYHLPFSYATHDPFGMKDWSNSQVINLLISKEQKGNCFALTALFKILSDQFNSEVRICTAPQHIYIQHRDKKGDYYNVELATAGHPGDGLIQTLTYTTTDAIMSGIALRSYDAKQSIGLCLVNLAKSYEHKFQIKNDEFILRCAELVLKHDSLNLNALLLKQQALDASVTDYAVRNKISNINRLKQDPKISKTLYGLEKHIALLYRLGYRQMPMDMQEMVLNGFRNENNGSFLTDKNPSPFTTIKPKDPDDARYLTLSHGVFQEVFEKKEQENYGHFTFKTETKKITAIDTASRTGFLIDPVAFAYDFGARMYDARTGIFISVDPSARKMPGWSPYGAFNNNPIMNVDPDGRDAKVAIKGNTVTISTTIYIYGSGAIKATASEMQKNIMNTWAQDASGNNWKYTDQATGQSYNVVFDIKVQQYDPTDPSAEPGVFSGKNNPFNTDNYIQIDNNATRSFVRGGDEGVWRGQGRNGLSLSQDDPAPHETGHLLGLPDQYIEGGGAKLGWQGNVMAEPAMQGKVGQKNIDQMVAPLIQEYNQSFTKSVNDKLGTNIQHDTKIDPK